MVAAMGPKYRKYLWWKKYMTWIQLIQFTIMLAYLVLLVVFDCKFSRSLTFFFVGNVVIFLYLFSKFYIQSYSSKKVSADTLDHNENLQITDKNVNNKKQDWFYLSILYLPNTQTTTTKTNDNNFRVLNRIWTWFVAQETTWINRIFSRD